MEHLAERARSAAGVPISITMRPATPDDAELVYKLYQATPDYFRIISIPMPTLGEVARELEAAATDARRFTELVLAPVEVDGLSDPVSERQVVGYLDYKMHYPAEGDVMVNLLLIVGRLQSGGFGRACVADLEARLHGQARRVLASIYGQNPRAEQFWRSLGYHFAIDAKPVLDWYAKPLSEAA